MVTNTIIIEFTPCEPPPANGYVVKYKKLGSLDELITWPDNFLTSPAILQIDGDPIGQDYEGTIQGDCGNGNFGVPVPWQAINNDSASESVPCHEVCIYISGNLINSANELTDQAAIGSYTPLTQVTTSCFKMDPGETHYLISIVVPKLGGIDASDDYNIGGDAGAAFVGQDDLGDSWRLYLWNDDFGFVDCGSILLTANSDTLTSCPMNAFHPFSGALTILKSTEGAIGISGTILCGSPCPCALGTGTIVARVSPSSPCRPCEDVVSFDGNWVFGPSGYLSYVGPPTTIPCEGLLVGADFTDPCGIVEA